MQKIHMVGPTPFEGSDNNVIVSPVELSDADAISSSVFQLIDPLAQSSEMVTDIFLRAQEQTFSGHDEIL